ncbi:MAG: RHS repeat-associated core domain-containing protein, partial [Terriglobales bacterium]
INSGSETETCAYGTTGSPGYDEFGRLLQVNCVNASSTNIWNQTFAYDIYNNVTKSVPSGGAGITWAPGYSATNNQYTLAGTSYDSNGNLLTDTVHTYTWNQDNHPTAMTDVGITMVYDAFGRMVEKATGSTTYQQTLMSPIGPVALMQKQNLTQYRMPLPGGDIDVTGINFYHKDYLGSVPLVSSRGGRASVAARLFAPYGESYNNVGIAGDLNFTGDYQDLVAGTFDTPNRELNPTQGRWISPDPAHSGWNAYSYTTNPLGKTDPSGLCDVGVCGVGDGYGEGTASRGAEELDGFSTDYVAIFESVDFNGQNTNTFDVSTQTVVSYDYGIVGYQQFGGAICSGSCDGSDVPDEIPYAIYGLTGETLSGGYSGDGEVLMAANTDSPAWAFTKTLFSLQPQVDAWNKGYYKCLAKTAAGGATAPVVTHAAGVAATNAVENGASTIAGAYYHFTDARFTAWGKYSQVLVPNLAPKIAAVAEALDVAGWAYFDYELGKAIGECSGVLQ